MVICSYADITMDRAIAIARAFDAGRGGWTGTQDDDGWTYSLAGHEVEQHWLAITMSEPAAVDEVAALFENLVIAADAAYGYAGSDSSGPRQRSSIKFKLPGVF